MNEYIYDGNQLVVTDEMKATFLRDGFIIIKDLFNSQELKIIEDSLTGPDSISSPRFSFGRDDGDGRCARMSLWNQPGEDSTGTFARMAKMADTARDLMGGEVYHYHTKLIMKDARTGGKFVWHQDYGYWYNFACLFPHMITAFVAIDRCDTGNGCLQILRGSHKGGRIDHVQVGDQTGADLTRVEPLTRVLDTVDVELEPGSALFFHCNLLHTSAQNLSDRRRWALLACYNSRDNNPYRKDKHALYQPLSVLDNDALTRQGVDRHLHGKEFIKPDGAASGEYSEVPT